MSARSETKIETYLEARRELAALRRAEADEGKTPARTRAILLARAAVAEAERALTGGELARARRLETTPTLHPVAS